MSRASARTNQASAGWSTSQRPLSPSPTHCLRNAQSLGMHHAKLTTAHGDPASLPEPAALLCSIQQLYEPPSQVPAATPVADCSTCYAPYAMWRWAAGRGARLTASVVVHAGLRKHGIVLDLRLAERRAVARDQHELCCVIKIRQGVRFLFRCAWRCFASYQGHSRVFDDGSAAHLP